MNENSNGHEELIDQLRDWGTVEPLPTKQNAVHAGALRAKLSLRRKRLRNAFALVGSTCGLVLLSVYLTSPSSMHTDAQIDSALHTAPSGAADVGQNPNRHELLRQLSLQLAATDYEVVRLRNQLEELHADLRPAKEDLDNAGRVQRYYIARRQRVEEKVLDDWLAQNP